MFNKTCYIAIVRRDVFVFAFEFIMDSDANTLIFFVSSLINKVNKARPDRADVRRMGGPRRSPERWGDGARCRAPRDLYTLAGYTFQNLTIFRFCTITTCACRPASVGLPICPFVLLRAVNTKLNL